MSTFNKFDLKDYRNFYGKNLKCREKNPCILYSGTQGSHLSFATLSLGRGSCFTLRLWAWLAGAQVGHRAAPELGVVHCDVTAG